MEKLQYGDRRFILDPVPFSESDAKGCVRVYEVIDDWERFHGNFWERRDAIRHIESIAKGEDDGEM